MGPWRAGGAICLVGVGVAVATVGPEGLRSGALTVAENIDVVILAVALLVFLTLAAPKGTLRAPLLLAALAVPFLASRFGLLTVRNVQVAAGVIMAGLGAAVILSGSRRGRDWTDPVQRLTAALVSGDLELPHGVTAPQHVTVTAVGATAMLDLTPAVVTDGIVEIAVNCYAGRVVLRLPDGRRVAAGRVQHTWGISFDGRIDHPVPVMSSAEAGNDLAPGAAGPDVVVHVMGLVGLVELEARKG
ncbi:hypothetical protein [Actinoplanes sp. NPDC026670]|uniref:hypothetical protein n=1 Tax=Actinoplanes sp. NPDC026670 TaxID=3154700 RepID=UPI0033D183CE